MTLFDQIAASVQTDDLDAAIAPIQAILGQDDGGLASIFFAGPNEDAWPNATLTWRDRILREYVAYEMQQTCGDYTNADNCAAGMHSWTSATGKLPANTKCDHCDERYGDPT